MSDKIRIGFVGSGFMGQKAHLDNFVTFDDCEVVALAEGRAKTAEMVSRKYAIPKTYSNHREMLAEEELDAVVAILPYGLHHAVLPDILKAGKHLMTEKPICVKVETARELAALAEERELIYQVGYMKRFTPASTYAKSVIEDWTSSGRAGKMTYLRATMPPGDWMFRMDPALIADEPWPEYEGEAPEALPAEFGEEIASNYNAFVNYYIHQVNLIRFLLGENYHVTHADPSGAILVGTSDSGIPILLEMKGYGMRNGWEEYYKICFERGKIDISIPAPLARQRPGDVVVFKAFEDKGDPTWERPSLPAEWCFKVQAREFVRCVRDKAASISPASHAVLDLEVAMEYARTLSRSRS